MLFGQGIKRDFFKSTKTVSDFFNDFRHSMLSMLKVTFHPHNKLKILVELLINSTAYFY